MPRTLTTLLIAGLCAGIAAGEPTATKKAEPGAQAVDSSAKTLAELYPDEKKPQLWIGSKAPELKIAKFLRGDEVTGFEAGQTYVVEFWATWCGPCIAAFPHVAELQKSYGDKVRVIGVNVWERETGDSRAQKVQGFVDQHTEMAYTVALEDGTGMADTWMTPAGQNGIPAAFIVNGEGKVAWIGHPMSMEEPLGEIIEGKYDLAKAEKDMWNQQLAMTAYMDVRKSTSTGDWDHALVVSKALAKEAFQDEPMGLNALAWMMLNGDEAPKDCVDFAYKAAKQACEKTEWGEWMILDTYALAAFRTGHKDEAIKWQTKAVELAPEEAKGEVQAQLDSFNDNKG